jgi:hypothetical protein
MTRKGKESLMTLPPLSEQQQADVQRLLEVLRPRSEELLQHVAHLLVANPGPRSFGSTEFQLRDLLHDAGADFLQEALAQKKTATRAPR